MKYDLTQFAGRLAAIAAGETLEMWQFIGKDWLLVGKPNLDNLARNGVGPLQETFYHWTIAPKPERSVTITRKQLEAAISKAESMCKSQHYRRAFMDDVAKELGLGEDVE
jgi:hypothetical protein